jgi:hypothetical protein
MTPGDMKAAQGVVPRMESSHLPLVDPASRGSFTLEQPPSATPPQRKGTMTEEVRGPLVL